MSFLSSLSAKNTSTCFTFTSHVLNMDRTLSFISKKYMTCIYNYKYNKSSLQFHNSALKSIVKKLNIIFIRKKNYKKINFFLFST